MSEVGSAALVLALLVVATLAGMLVRPLLPEEHKAHETVQLIQLVIGMLVTFAALVLGLMTASAKATFDGVGDGVRTYAADLIQLDVMLREYGLDADPIRRDLRTYMAAAIATTWPQEPEPPGGYDHRYASTGNHAEHLEDHGLGNLLTQTEQALRRLHPADAFHEKLQGDSLMRFDRVIQARWTLIEDAHNSISQPFLKTLTFWLIVIFLSFGLIAPRNALALVVMTLGALSIASAIYVIVDLDTPFTGPIVISSQPLRDALVDLSCGEWTGREPASRSEAPNTGAPAVQYHRMNSSKFTRPFRLITSCRGKAPVLLIVE
jgi:hypothetical protein